jgi:hypothetical protein
MPERVTKMGVVRIGIDSDSHEKAHNDLVSLIQTHVCGQVGKKGHMVNLKQYVHVISETEGSLLNSLL